MKKNKKIIIFSILCIISLCIGLTFKYFQNDTFYIIKLGELISKNGIDFKDHYSWVSNLPYTYPHWLYDLIIYFIYNYFEYIGVYISVIICFIFLILCIYFINIKLHKNYLAAFLVSIISIFRLSMFAVARSQIISLPLFILEVYFINKLIDTGKNKYIIYLCILSLLIANLHATTWLFYFILFLPFIGEQLIYKLSKNKKIRRLYKLDKYKNSKIIICNINYFRKIIICFILTFLMGILSPSRICYTYVFKVMKGNSQNVLLEHLPLKVIENPFFIFLILLLALLLSLPKTKIYLRELFMISGLILMSLISTRHLAFFYTIGLLYITIICIRYLDTIKDNTLNILEDILINNKIVLIILSIIILTFSSYNFYNHSKEDYTKQDEYPIKAVKYIKDNLDYKNIRLYNNYNYGSYLLFKDIPVFIDSRCDLYLKEFNNMDYSIFDELEDLPFNYKDRFKYHNVTHALIDKNSVLYIILENDINYNTIYEDKYFILFERIGE